MFRTAGGVGAFRESSLDSRVWKREIGERDSEYSFLHFMAEGKIKLAVYPSAAWMCFVACNVE